MTPPYDFTAIAPPLKRAMKKKGLAYRDLAEAVGMSESGIKKLMTGDDVTLSRLAEICEAIDIDLLGLLEAAWRPAHAPVVLTAEQEAFIASHPHHLTFFQALLGCDFDLEAVMRDFDLDRCSVDRYVGALEDAGFVIVTSTGAVKSAFGPRGEWFRYRDPNAAERQIASLRAALDGDRSQRCIRNGRIELTTEHLEQLNREILELLLRWQSIASQDKLYVDDDQLIDVWVLAGTARQRFCDVARIPRIEPGGYRQEA